jgi:signal transduction histidine kinase
MSPLGRAERTSLAGRGRNGGPRAPDRSLAPSIGPGLDAGPFVLGAVSTSHLGRALVQIRDDLGFDTASLFGRGPGGWDLIERHGPDQPWHGVLDPSILEGTEQAAEYPDVRAIPGAGSRLARLGCASVAMLPLPDGGRVLLDSGSPCSVGGWIERAAPYLELVGIASGPAWSAGGALQSQEEVRALDRMFTACQDTLARPGATVEDLVGAARHALQADELFLLCDRGADLEVVASPVAGRPKRLTRERQMMLLPHADLSLDEHTLHRLTLALRAPSRALSGAFGRHGDGAEVVVAGWAEGPALSPVAVTVVARTLSTAKAALLARRQAVTTMVDRERTRMAYALHDGLTQTVAGAVLELEALAKHVERDPAGAIVALDGSKMEIRRALGELRGMLFDLSRASDEDAKPPEPLTQYVEDVVKRWRLPARVAVEGDLSAVPRRVLSVAYVVIRETLANAAKHADGRNVTVTLSATDQDLVVTVGDGGRGFTPRDELAARETKHIGLDMLRRRVDEVGGTLQVDSRPGKGTRVIARLPIHGVAS